jgi:hypothetical protein
MRRTQMWLTAAGATAVALYIGTGQLMATPPAGFTGATLALGRFQAFEVENHFAAPEDQRTAAEGGWESMQKTEGASDVYVQSNVWQPGGTTGWHSHPGHSLILVTAGTLTVYDGADPNCTPHTYTQGMGFVDPGGDHVHIIRNEGSVEARTTAVQVIPAGAARRIDAPAPGTCGF